MEEILDLAKKVAEEAEVYTVTTEETPVQFVLEGEGSRWEWRYLPLLEFRPVV